MLHAWGGQHHAVALSVCRAILSIQGHEAAFRADQGLRTRHGHRRLGNVVLSARAFPGAANGQPQYVVVTWSSCKWIPHSDAISKGLGPWGIHLTQVAPRRCGLVDPWTPAHCTQNAPWGARRRSAGNWATRLRFRADQGLRTRHGHRRLGNVVLSATPFRGPPMANHSMLWSPESNGYPTISKIEPCHSSRLHLFYC